MDKHFIDICRSKPKKKHKKSNKQMHKETNQTNTHTNASLLKNDSLLLNKLINKKQTHKQT